MINTRRSTNRQITVKMLRSEDKEKILKAVQKKKTHHLPGNTKKKIISFSLETMEVKCSGITCSRCAKKNSPPSILRWQNLLSKIKGKIKALSDQKQKCVSRAALQKILLKVLQVEHKWIWYILSKQTKSTRTG